VSSGCAPLSIGKWVNAAHQSSSSNESYGYMWWMNKSEAWKGVSPDVYFAAGFEETIS
jgi:hypothetical protein